MILRIEFYKRLISLASKKSPPPVPKAGAIESTITR
jgi:hypothetical protein